MLGLPDKNFKADIIIVFRTLRKIGSDELETRQSQQWQMEKSNIWNLKCGLNITTEWRTRRFDECENKLLEISQSEDKEKNVPK